MKRYACALAAFSLALATGCVSLDEAPTEAGTGAVVAGLQYPVLKTRPDGTPSVASRALVRLAGGEREAVAVVIANRGSGAVDLVTLSVRFEEAAGISARLYLVDYVDVLKRSRWFDPPASGEWPDPLIPVGAASDGGVEAVFPDGAINVRSGGNRVAIVDFALRRGARSPIRAIVEAGLSNGERFSFTIDLEPFAFDLPETPSAYAPVGSAVPNVAGVHGRLAGVELGTEERAALVEDYLDTLADFRLFPYDYAYIVPSYRSDSGELVVDWNAYEAAAGPYLDGAYGDDGFECPAVFVPAPQLALTAEEANRFYGELHERYAGTGRLERMFSYLPDEPVFREYGNVMRLAEQSRALVPEAATLVTDPFGNELEPYVDIWCADLISIGDSIPLFPAFARGGNLLPDWQRDVAPEAYRIAAARGQRTWMYSCNSAMALDYPNMYIDGGMAYARILPWIMYRYGFEALLYYHAMYAYVEDRTSWRDQFRFFTNGDGNLLYPVVPGPLSAVHRAAPCLRVLALRDGFEDYEYLALLGRAAGSNAALSLAALAAESSLVWIHDDRELAGRRDALGAAVERAIAAGGTQ